MFMFILLLIIIGFIWYLWSVNAELNYKKYLPELPVMNDPKTNKPVSKQKLLKVARKIEKKVSLDDTDIAMLRNAYSMTLEDYKVEESEKHDSSIYTPTNEVPINSETKIRQNADGLIYFSKQYQKKPDHLYKLLDYSWGGPRYETTYNTTTTSKNKHLVPIINQKRTGTSTTTSSTTAHATLGQLLLIDLDNNDKILSEANIDSDQNNVISRFKLWPDTSNQQNSQDKNNEDSNNSSSSSTDLLDELPKLKKMLDDGILTQDEFDAKKKQILGI